MNESMNACWLRWSLAAITVLLAIIAVELSVLIGPVIPQAQAQIPDSGLQRRQMVGEQQRTNAILERLLTHIRTQSIKVEVVGTDKDSKRTAAPAPRAPLKAGGQRGGNPPVAGR